MWPIPQVNQNIELQLVFQGTQPCLNLAQLLLRRYTPQCLPKTFPFLVLSFDSCCFQARQQLLSYRLTFYAEGTKRLIIHLAGLTITQPRFRRMLKI
jgi:hypothetical protein